MAMMTFSCASLSSTFSLFKRNRFVSCYFWAAALISPFTAVTSFASSTTTTTSASVPVRNSFLLKSRGGGGEADSSCGLHQQRVPSTLFSPRQTAALTTSALRQSTAASTEVTPTAEHTMDAATKLSALRKSMRELDLDVYLVPTDDPHLSEYVPEAYKRRAFLSGFLGSAGTAVVTANDNKDGENGKAYLWTDSRYWNEAGLQLNASHWTLQKSGLLETPTIPKWLSATAVEHYQQFHKPLRIGIDPYVHAASMAKEVQDLLADAAKDQGWDEHPGLLVTEHENLVDSIWGEARPPIPISPFRVHPMAYAGTTVAEKIQVIRREMKVKKATAAVFCTLDDVAYVLNLRAKGDIDTCPVGIAYCLVTAAAAATTSESDKTAIYLYCDERKISQDAAVQAHLAECCVTVKPYDQIVPDIEQHCRANPLNSINKVWLDTARANYAIRSVIPEQNLVDAQNAVTPMKAVKNEVELAGMREAHIVDGAAMAKFMAWLENEINAQKRSVSEVEIDQVLTGCRAEQMGFTECSFPTIAGVGSNGAIIHYRASTENPDLLKYLDKSAPILIDSGGQYLYGTTDVTRTWSFQDQPDPVFMEYYTRVLKGNIGLDSMIFPENTPGFVLDVFARKWLWDIGANYRHGTGHGVGSALNVHEGPQSVSPRWANTEVLKAGMVVSNEPGYYEDGNFGIRIENLLEILFVKPDRNRIQKQSLVDASQGNDDKFLRFAKLTMIPIQKNLININLMTDDELNWLDNYHAEVLEKVGARLEEGSPAMAWLQTACEKINRTRNQV